MKFLIPVLILILFCACAEDPIDNGNNPDPSMEDSIDIETLKNAMLHFGFESFQRINQEEGAQNVLVSPLSLEIALYMALNGAEGQTLKEMQAALNLENISPQGLNTTLNTLLEEFDGSSSPNSFLNMNQGTFWNPMLLAISDDFVKTMEDYYDCEMYDDRFTADEINAWANEKTEGRIPKVLDEIKEDEIMFLLNAIYFKGDWLNPFDPELTRDALFTLSTGEETEVPTMVMDYNISHYRGVEFSAVDLVFEGEEFAMTCLKPEDGVDKFLTEKTSEELIALYTDLIDKQLHTDRLLVMLPKFELKFKRELKEDLIALGMERAFQEGNAEFEKFGSAGGNIFLTRVIHDTFLKVDEKGAEGAAVTTVGVGVESVPPIIQFNRPFLVILRHIDSKIPLFVGKVSSPIN